MNTTSELVGPSLFGSCVELPVRALPLPIFETFNPTSDAVAVELLLLAHAVSRDGQLVPGLHLPLRFQYKDVGNYGEDGSALRILVPQPPRWEVDCKASGVLKRYQSPCETIYPISPLVVLGKMEAQRCGKGFVFPLVTVEGKVKYGSLEVNATALAYVDAVETRWPHYSFPIQTISTVQDLRRRKTGREYRDVIRRMVDQGVTNEWLMLMEIKRLHRLGKLDKVPCLRTIRRRRDAALAGDKWDPKSV